MDTVVLPAATSVTILSRLGVLPPPPPRLAGQGDDVVVVRHDLGSPAAAAGPTSDRLEIELDAVGDGLDEDESRIRLVNQDFF